jgi:hypothetical protein
LNNRRKIDYGEHPELVIFFTRKKKRERKKGEEKIQILFLPA